MSTINVLSKDEIEALLKEVSLDTDVMTSKNNSGQPMFSAAESKIKPRKTMVNELKVDSIFYDLDKLTEELLPVITNRLSAVLGLSVCLELAKRESHTKEIEESKKQAEVFFRELVGKDNTQVVKIVFNCAFARNLVEYFFGGNGVYAHLANQQLSWCGSEKLLAERVSKSVSQLIISEWQQKIKYEFQEEKSKKGMEKNYISCGSPLVQTIECQINDSYEKFHLIYSRELISALRDNKELAKRYSTKP